VFSLCEAEDLLSLWRGYGSQIGGYSLGFDAANLKSYLEQEKLFLLPCVYDDYSHRILIAQLIDNTIARYKQSLENGLSIEESKNYFKENFIQIAPLIKHFSFHEEREWRMFSGILGFNHPSWGYRLGKSMIIPHLNFKFDSSLVTEVVVGPNQNTQLATRSVSGALWNYGMRAAIVKGSGTPYREC
jgi:hypothetical protein